MFGTVLRNVSLQRNSPPPRFQEPGEGAYVYVRAANDDHHALAFDLLAKGAKSTGGGSRASRLDGQLELGEQNGGRLAHLVVRNQGQLVNRLAAQTEAVRKHVGRGEAVRDGRGHPCGLWLTRAKGAEHRVGPNRLHRENPACGYKLLHRRSNARAQASTTDRDDYTVWRGDLLREFESERARSGGCVRPLVRMDQRPALLRANRLDHGHRSDAVGGEQDFPAQPTTILDARRIGAREHNDLRCGTEDLRSIGDCCSMIARAERGEPVLTSGRVEVHGDIQRAPGLERAGYLEQLELYPDLGAGAEQAPGCRSLPAVNRSPHDVGRQSIRGRQNGGQGRRRDCVRSGSQLQRRRASLVRTHREPTLNSHVYSVVPAGPHIRNFLADMQLFY